LYGSDLAYIHHAGFSDFAIRAAPEIIGILRRHGITSGCVVDAGCGSGILSSALVAAGYDVVGFDASPAMIRLARRNAPGARFRVASLASMALPPCDAIVAAGEVVSYAVSLRRFFARAHGSLRPRGLFVFDFVESSTRRTYLPKGMVTADWALAVRADVSRDGRELVRRIVTARRVGRRWRRQFEIHRVHIRRRSEMRQLLTAAGFSAVMGAAYGRCRLMAGDVAVIAEKH
jgi:SAM-dependent methyltransferase